MFSNNLKEDNDRLKSLLKSARNLLQTQGEMLQQIHSQVCPTCHDKLFKSEAEIPTAVAGKVIDLDYKQIMHLVEGGPEK